VERAVVVLALASGALAEEYDVDASVLGQPLRSIGAQSTAGTSRLLYDYVEPQRAQLLDLLFTPHFGASFQHLKVEIGGDAQISCGAEASAMRSANRSEDDFSRGYEGWLMREAKQRNPDLQLLGLVYAWPAWIDPSGSGSPYTSAASERNAAEYVSSWVSGVRAEHNVSVDNVGIFNEQSYTTSYIKTLRATLDAAGHTATTIVASDKSWDPISTDYLANAQLRTAVAALTSHYPSCDAAAGTCTGRNSHTGYVHAQQAHLEHGVELWSSEDYSCWTDPLGAARWASDVNSQYIGGNITLVSAWHLASSFYPTVPFWNEGMISATQPWSGHFVTSPTVWASAHTTQFTWPGIRILPQDRGAGALAGGGTFVSYVDEAREQLSIVIETAGAAVAAFCAENCNGACPISAATAAQNATFVLRGLAAVPPTFALRRTRLGGAAAVDDAQLFEALPDARVRVAGGVATVTLVLEADALYTLSTVRAATKAGDAPLTLPPASAPFPLPHRDDFDDPKRPLASPGRYWSDMEGAFELAPSATAGVGGRVLKQSVRRAACCPFIPSLNGPLPLTVLGSSAWENVEVAVSVALPVSENASFALLGIRAKFQRASFFKRGLGLPSGLFLGVDGTGVQVLQSVAAAASGLQWPCNPAHCLAHGTFVHPGRGVWRRIELGAVNRTLSFSALDSVSGTLSLPPTVGLGGGFAALATSYGAAVEFDNFTIRASPSAPVVSRCDAAPAAGQAVVAVGCGEPAAERGSRWDLPPAGSEAAITLRSDPSLCLAATPTPAAPTPPPPTPPPLAPTPPPTPQAQVASWRTGPTGHASTVAVSADAKWATWRAAPGRAGCNGVVLAAAAASRFWVQLQAPAPAAPPVPTAGTASWVDVGFCTPGVDVSGHTWLGWQGGKAWLYRGEGGQFKGDASTTSQGEPYGAMFGAGANVTAIRHNATALEFLLDGASQGVVAQGAGSALPAGAVPCVSACVPLAAGLASGVAPPAPAPPPPLPPNQAVLVTCRTGDAAQRWRYDTVAGTITNAMGGVLSWGDRGSASDAGDFVPLSVGAGSGDNTRWSPDLGYVHGHSNKPMQCNCMAVCG
jgi:galactosylceramidase